MHDQDEGRVAQATPCRHRRSQGRGVLGYQRSASPKLLRSKMRERRRRDPGRRGDVGTTISTKQYRRRRSGSDVVGPCQVGVKGHPGRRRSARRASVRLDFRLARRTCAGFGDRRGRPGRRCPRKELSSPRPSSVEAGDASSKSIAGPTVTVSRFPYTPSFPVSDNCKSISSPEQSEDHLPGAATLDVKVVRQ